MFDRFFQFLLKLFPKDFQEAHGREMRQVYRLQARDGFTTRLRAMAEMLRSAPAEHWDAFKQDTRLAFRGMRGNPGFTAIAVVTVALGIGANAAIFSVFDAVLLRQLPYRDARRLVSLRLFWQGFGFGSVSIPEYLDLRESRAFRGVSAYQNLSVNFALGEGSPERITACEGTEGLFDLLGVAPFIGRTFLPENHQPGGDQVLMLSYGLWQRRFGANPEIVGRSFRIEGRDYTVIGVMPREFYFPDKDTELWVPSVIPARERQSRGVHNRSVVARLAPGIDVSRAQSELDALAKRMPLDYPADYPNDGSFSLTTTSLHEVTVGESSSRLVLLLSATGFLLLIACVNVANLLLARNSSRQRELAVRTALGARNSRLKRQLVTESLWLAIAGGLLGLVLAVIGVANASVLGAAQIPRLEEAAIDLRVLAVAAILALLTSVLFGVLPASRFVRQDVNKWLRSGTRGTADRLGVRTRRVLVVSEIALATVLLVGCGLTLRSLQRLTAVDPGLDTDKVVTARISLAARYSEASQRIDFFKRLVEGIQKRPGITAAGAISVLPLTGGTEDWAFSVENYLPPNGRSVVTEQTRFITGEYFRTLSIPLKKGRGFDHFDDRVDAPRVAIVSESFARKYWKDSEAVGKRLKLATRRDDSPWVSVVGIVGDIRHLGPHVEQQPFIYYPAAQYNQSRMALVARSDSAAGSVAAAIREEVGELDAEQAVFGVKTMAQYASESIGQFRFTSLILTFIGTLALLLASVGIYGVMAHSISQRTHEIGVRLALGAMRSSIFGSVVGQGFVLASIGIVLGTIGGFFVGRSIRTQLFDVGPLDPIALGGAVAVLFAISLLACYFPARRATRIDPATALRME